MSQPTLGPRVIEVTDAAKATLTESIVPRVVEIEDARPIEPPARAVPTPIVEPRRRRNRPRRIALAALGLSVVGFLILEAATWLGAQFERGLFLGLISATVLGCGALSSVYWIAAELRGLLALKAVESVQADAVRAMGRASIEGADRRIARILQGLHEVTALQPSIADYQARVKPNHSAQQRIELISLLVLPGADAAASRAIRRAVVAAFAMTALSPRPLNETLFFLGRSLAMVREIAESYGHRPGVIGTAHLMRRLVFNAGMVATADLVGDKLSQDFGDTALELVGFAPGGATLKAVLAKSGESLFAAQRMARLGILAMKSCRPVAFAPDQVPTISRLIGESFKREGKTTSSSS